MIDIHDEYRPTGYSRTYPNLMTQEGIAGDETKPSNAQTLTILFAWYLAPLGLDDTLEAALVLLGTVGGCALGYEIIRRFTVTRFLFGLKLGQRPPSQECEGQPSTA